jgi:hypothetical protein
MRSFERTPTFEQGIKAALKARKFPKALDLESYEVVYGKHFLQEDSSPAIASSIAGLIRAR